MYKRSFSGSYLLCVHPKAIELILEELHEGICESHTGVGLYHIGPLHKATGGRRCRKKHRTMQRSVTSARGLPQTFTNLGKSLILCLVLGLSLNGAWIL